MKKIIFLFVFSLAQLLHAQDIDEVHVYKSKHQLNLISAGKVVKSYSVMLGRGGRGPKRQAGDHLVPEGKYFLDFKNPESLFHKSIHISYPNEDDLRRANEAGVDPGGDIMIHGYPNYPKPIFKFLRKIGLIKKIDWTAGCVALDNQEMEEIFENLEVPLPITIYH
jgi:murein L,D-transpeptidase YafK